MHFIAILTSLAILAFWVGRAAGGWGNIFGAGRAVANMPRKRAHAQQANRRGYELVKTPTEAATVLMLSVAKLSEQRHVTPDAQREIKAQLYEHMQLPRETAADVVLSMKALTHEITLPESALFPMVDILRTDVSREDCEELAKMLERVAHQGEINQAQKAFIHRFRERLDLL